MFTQNFQFKTVQIMGGVGTSKIKTSKGQNIKSFQDDKNVKSQKDHNIKRSQRQKITTSKDHNIER